MIGFQSLANAISALAQQHMEILYSTPNGKSPRRVNRESSFVNSANSVFRVKTQSNFCQPMSSYVSLRQPMSTNLAPLFFSAAPSRWLIHRNFPGQAWSRLVHPNPAWSNTFENKFMNHSQKAALNEFFPFSSKASRSRGDEALTNPNHSRLFQSIQAFLVLPGGGMYP
jgi:hypothetical protein